MKLKHCNCKVMLQETTVFLHHLSQVYKAYIYDTIHMFSLMFYFRLNSNFQQIINNLEQI